MAGIAFMARNGMKNILLWIHDHEGAYRKLPLFETWFSYMIMMTSLGPHPMEA